MATTKSSWVWLDLSLPTQVADNADRTIRKQVPFAGRVAQVSLYINTLLTTGGGILALGKNGATPSVLSSASINLGSHTTPDLAAATSEDLTLTTLVQNYTLAANDELVATYTMTTATSTAANANTLSLLVAIEPDLY